VITVGILHIGNEVYLGRQEDVCSPIVHQMVEDYLGDTAFLYALVPEDGRVVGATLTVWADEVGLDLIFTTGEAESSSRSLTLQATRTVIQHENMELDRLMRECNTSASAGIPPGEGMAGHRGHTLVVNLPDDPDWVVDMLCVVLPYLAQILL